MGALPSLFSQSLPPKSKFVPERDIPDLTGKVVIVTGGNTGIGFHTVEELLKKNAKVYMGARTKSRADAATAKLKMITGKEAIFLELDLADLDNVTRAANEFKSKEPELHILFNSAGVMIPPMDQVTANGYDLQFGTNVLGHAHFTLSLVPALLAGAKTSSDGKARVIHTASSAVYFTPKGGIIWDTLKTDVVAQEARKKLGGQGLYAQSKLGNVIFSNEFARRYADQGIISNSCNPGNLQTELQRNVPIIGKAILYWILYPAPYGALTQLWGGTSPETRDMNGQYLIPWARLSKSPTSEARDPDLARKLWDWIAEQRQGH